MRFEDITKKSGLRALGKWATGVAMVDIDLDGWLDIYVCYAVPFSNPQQRQMSYTSTTEIIHSQKRLLRMD